MPGRRTAASSLLLGLLVLLAAACGGDEGEVALLWQTEDGKPLDVSIDDLNANYDTVIYVDNTSGETIRDAVLRFSPSEVHSAPIGFSIGTMTSVRTDFEGATHIWRLGDIEPNTRVVFSLSLWFSAAVQLEKAPPVDLVVQLQSKNLPDAVASNALTVHFQP